MSNINRYYEALIQVQKGYLNSIHILAVKNPCACGKILNMKPSQVSSLANQTSESWARFISNLKSWVLFPKKDIADNCLFEYFINNINSYESITNQVNSRISLGLNMPYDIDDLSKVSKYQSAIFQNICLCVLEDPLFTKGLLFMKQSTIDLIADSYLTSNKLHFIDPVIPFFVINNSIDYGIFFSDDSNACHHVEQVLFSIVA
ncbi:MAG: hypothetical protein V7749_00085 [Cocleimonas sp.]